MRQLGLWLLLALPAHAWLYVLVAFAVWDLDVAHWGPGARTIYTFLVLLWAWVSYNIAKEYEPDAA